MLTSYSNEGGKKRPEAVLNTNPKNKPLTPHCANHKKKHRLFSHFFLKRQLVELFEMKCVAATTRQSLCA